MTSLTLRECDRTNSSASAPFVLNASSHQDRGFSLPISGRLIRSPSLKISTSLEFGDEHESSAEAVANATIRVFKRSAILALATRDGEVARQLWEMTARELHRAQNHMMLLIKSAQERVVSFLLEMAIRTSGTNEVELPMSRLDIADYLGLTIETVSRTLSQLENGGVITVPTSRRIVWRNRSALNNLSADRAA